MKSVASAGVWGGFAGAPSLAHSHVGQGPGHMGLVARSEAPEPRWVGPVMGVVLCSHPHTCPFIHGCLLYKLPHWKSLGAAGLLLAPAGPSPG